MGDAGIGVGDLGKVSVGLSRRRSRATGEIVGVRICGGVVRSGHVAASGVAAGVSHGLDLAGVEICVARDR